MAAHESKEVHIPGIAGGDLPENEREAFEEGHDADVPSHTAAVDPTPHQTQHNQPADIEKGSKRDVSSTSSINGDRDVEKGGALETSEEKEEQPHDPNIVDWEGPDDPANPQNWTAGKKWSNIAILSFLTLLTPLASSMFAPGVPDVIKEFHTSKYVQTSRRQC